MGSANREIGFAPRPVGRLCPDGHLRFRVLFDAASLRSGAQAETQELQQSHTCARDGLP
jgi:hypothetical protein